MVRRFTAHNINMIINVVALITAVYYIINIPLVAKISLARTGDINIAFGAFSANPGIKFNTDVKSLISGSFKKKRRIKPIPVRAIFQSVEFRSAKVEVSMPDAYYTALVSGAVAGVLSAAGFKKARVIPDFSANGASLSASCIISATVGKALIISGNMALSALKEKIKLWNSTDRLTA